MHRLNTLKLKIIVLAVVTGVVSALGTAQLVLNSTRVEIEHLVLAGAVDEAHGRATLLASKLDTLQLTLKSVAAQVAPAMWLDPDLMRRFLQEKPAAGALFDSISAARADGTMIVRLVKGEATAELPHIADRPYFQRAMKSDQPVLSEPVIGRISKAPILVMALAVPSATGKPDGILAGSVELASARLFLSLGGDAQEGSRSMILDRMGVLLAHPDPKRVMAQADSEPGLREVFRHWRDRGSPINTEGTATFSGDYLISMAGIAFSDWVLVRLTPRVSALQPVMVAQRTAWLTAVGVGCLSALLAGLVAFLLVRPISQLQARATRLLTQDADLHEPWPEQSGEVGSLARVFAKVVEQRQQRHDETQSLLLQLEAVLDYADVGIALTRDGRIELVSTQFCAIFHCQKHQAIGLSTRIIYASDEAYAALAALAKPEFERVGSFEGEVELLRFTGELFWAALRGRAISLGDPSKGTIWTIEDVTDERARREKLTWAANHDALTRLSNRVAFEACLENAIAEVATEPFCVLFIDLDRFKYVNDTGGHAAGDAMLRGIADQLSTQVRRSDTVARIGGDEFAMFLHKCPLSQAHEIAEKLRLAVISYQLEWEGQRYGVGASIGLVSVDARFTTGAEVMRAADAACYAAKQAGRDRVAVYEEDTAA
ncbi:MAG: diguanylate cyclase [Burkholderiaceae bacterium]